ncbi:MAG: hypothetical protein GY703_01950 [Gammaproteobacteria bacterium]|nr:hypothetical protein [Gammaproteobacteria bacterium]
MWNDPPDASSGFFYVNLIVLAVAVGTLSLWAFSPIRYFALVQEDSALEWATVWAFVGAACCFLRVAIQPRPIRLRASWFAFGLALFCMFIALEEVSWGQRQFHFRSSELFLTHNYQSEANLHNLVTPSLLFLAFVSLVVVYGVLLPLVVRAQAIGRLLSGMGVTPPPSALVPSYLLTVLISVVTPDGVIGLSLVPFGNEVPELMFGTALLASAWALSIDVNGDRLPRAAGPILAVILSFSGFAAVWVLDVVSQSHETDICLAINEMEAMGRDFHYGHESLPRSPGLELRVSTFVGYGNAPRLQRGDFVARVEAGFLPTARASHFLDPWNQPYWVADRYYAGSRLMFLYSHGPNARADKVAGYRTGDDVGLIIAGDVSVVQQGGYMSHDFFTEPSNSCRKPSGLD